MVTKTIPNKKKWKEEKWLSEEVLQITEDRKVMKWLGMAGQRRTDLVS